jgi:hypothetical protein
MPRVQTAESAPKERSVPRAIYSVYTRDIARANGAQIAATMRETSRRPHCCARCRERGSRPTQSAVRCAIVALGGSCWQRGAYACVRHRHACAVAGSNRTPSVATADANHRLMSRPPSRRQQFDPRRVSQGGDRRFMGPVSDGARRTREPFTECCDRPAKTP